MVKYNIDEVKKTYPKGMKIYYTWMKSTQQAYYDRMSKEIGEQVHGDVTDEFIVNLADTIAMYTPRELYDFFDSQDVKISISPSTEDATLWTYWNSQIRHSSTAPSRVEAETKAFTAGFEYLEKKES
jgi:hypothetical protein